MISYASTKSFINTFSQSLRILAAPCGVEVVTVKPGFIDTLMTKHMRGLDTSVPVGMALLMKRAVEKGGVGVVNWPPRQSIAMSAVKSKHIIAQKIVDVD
jgi:short-subunit dehydrogenase